MTATIKAPCGCACRVVLGGERPRIVVTSWCRTKGHREMRDGVVSLKRWQIRTTGGDA